MKRLFAAILALCLLALPACSTGEYVPTEDAEYELVYEWGALVLKENGKTIDSWKARDIFAISGGSMLDSATVQGKKPVRAFFKEMFGVGVPLSLVAQEDMPKYDAVTMEAYGLSYEDIDPDGFVYSMDTTGLRAIFVVPIELLSEETNSFFFVDRYGNYYEADPSVLSSGELRFYMINNHSGALIEHEGE